MRTARHRRRAAPGRPMCSPPNSHASPSYRRRTRSGTSSRRCTTWSARAGRQCPRSRPMDVDARAEFLQTFGLRNQWYIVAASAEVGERAGRREAARRRTRALARRRRRRARGRESLPASRRGALDRRSARRRSSRARITACASTSTAKVVLVPGPARVPARGQDAASSIIPVIEHYQAIWAYFGDDRHRRAPPLVLPEELVSPEWTGVLHYDTWRGDYRYVIDNLCDPMHGPFLARENVHAVARPAHRSRESRRKRRRL